MKSNLSRGLLQHSSLARTGALFFALVPFAAQAESIHQVTQISYDSSGNPACVTVRMNQAAFGALPSNACDLGPPGAQGNDRVEKYMYDPAGRLVQIRKAVGTPVEQAYVTYTYSPNGLKTTVIDANGNRANLEYDGLDRHIKWVFPSQSRPSAYNAATPSSVIASAGAANANDFEQYAYDPNGNRTSLRKRDGSVISYQYDALNRVTQKTVPERVGLAVTHTRDVFYGYDLRGLLSFARFDSVSGEGVTTIYDGFGRIQSSNLTMDGTSRTLTYQYDIRGNRTRVTFPDGNYATYSYDGRGRPQAIHRSGTAILANYTYDTTGRRTALIGGVSTSYGYDAAGRLNSMTNNLPATAYNNQWTFAYNPASQITQAVRSNDTFAWTAHVNVNRAYVTNGLNQYSAAGPATFGYDPNGNLTSDGSTTFLYDIENRLVSASGAKTAALRYDPMGRLYEVSGSSGTTRFLYDGDALVAEYSTTGSLLRRYVHGADAKSDDPIAWYEGAAFNAASERRLRPDWLGSIVLVTDSTGNSVLAVNRFDEYGIPQSTNAGRFQYTGQAWIAELGMYHYKARIYSPTLGRFLQTDPVAYDDQFNLYAYVGNEPISNTDPDGKKIRYQGTVKEQGELVLMHRFIANLDPEFRQRIDALENSKYLFTIRFAIGNEPSSSVPTSFDRKASSNGRGTGAQIVVRRAMPGEKTHDGTPANTLATLVHEFLGHAFDQMRGVDDTRRDLTVKTQDQLMRESIAIAIENKFRASVGLRLRKVWK